MQICELKNDGLSRTIQIVVPAAILAERLERKIEEVKPRLQLKGFRPGKAPSSYVKKLYGRGLMGELLEQALQESAQQAIADNKWKLAGQPSMHMESNVEAVAAGEADLSFHMHVELMPEFTLMDPQTIVLTRPRAIADGSDLETTLANLAKENPVFELKDGPAGDGDAILVDFVGRIDGVAFDGGTATGATITLGAGRFLPDFEKGVAGARTGEERVFDVSFPDDYAAAHLAGKTAQFTADVKEVKAPRFPTADGELASQLGFADFAALQEAARAQLQGELDGLARQVLKRRLLDRLDESHQFEAPPGLIEEEFQQIWRQVEQARTENQLDADDLAKSVEELESDYRKIAMRRVRLGLVLAEFGTRASIHVTDEEVSRAIIDEARKFPGQTKQVVDFYRKNPNAVAAMRAPIFEEKVVNYLLELIKPAEETVSKDELRSLADAA